ncbi:UDP-glucose dehydrogenase family protein [Caldicellulosiruptor morganii]|uniref:UDP-glucose 6-dehydrogenase n=1 Tax=Caldicellulosiruptor morganii TaxID=1387555 RepID=A0ABY7BRB5_9FIRM|nr:UDP-glucose/GDP-mannose dehydrogenase family protein [Caldicellulosiruptor morganii]WAM35023.1 UDP-glucose/GDP-mannose dehydrogenase family protein [Caldicellulosiruptor morganii]
MSVIGTGYVGLTTGLLFAYLGNKVIFVDIDRQKIEKLKNRVIPFYEPYIEEMLNLVYSNLEFSTEYKEAIEKADIIFICVGTPPDKDGKPDLTGLTAAAKEIGRYLNGKFKVIVNKSTVPVGGGNWVESVIKTNLNDKCRSNQGHNFVVASNPEFLREGSALYDAFYPERIVIGADNNRAFEVLLELFRPIMNQSFNPPPFLPRPNGLSAVPIITTNLVSAELIKYASNAFLATKISFINEIANLCEKVGADIKEIAKGIGLDSRIGSKFLNAGVGWGGSCFGKDTAALVEMGKEYGLEMHIIEAVRKVNYLQRKRIIEKLYEKLKIVKGKTIGILGLAFKPNTDDLRDSPAIDIIRTLLERGAHLKVHDPVALDNFRSMYSSLNVVVNEDVYQMVEDCDALILVTDWDEYKELDWEKVKNIMAGNLIVDGRNALDEEQLSKLNFKYVGVGR